MGLLRTADCEGLQRFDLAEYLRRPDAVEPNASCIGTISNGKISAQIRYTETSTGFGCRRPWMLCPRCSRRCRVVFLGFRKGCVPALFSAAVPVAMPRPDPPRAARDGQDCKTNRSGGGGGLGSAGPAAGHALDRYNRLAEWIEHQSNVWNLMMMQALGLLIPRLRRRSAR